MEIYDRACLSIPTIVKEEIVENAAGRFSIFREAACVHRTRSRARDRRRERVFVKGTAGETVGNILGKRDRLTTETAPSRNAFPSARALWKLETRERLGGSLSLSLFFYSCYAARNFPRSG